MRCRGVIALAAATAALVAAGGAPSPAFAATGVEVMVAGRAEVLVAGRDVALRARHVRAGRHRCRVGGATPLAALAGAGVRLRVRDYGRCGRAARDASSLYVTAIDGTRARGANGWVYKVGHRVGSAGAGDPAGPFGSGGLRSGQRVLWFWCFSTAKGCQRTLAVRAGGSPRPRRPLLVSVRGYDDAGAGVPVAGAVVNLSGVKARTRADGTATLIVPERPRRGWRLTATRTGMVPSFVERP
jgi:hypothetical protein